MKLIEKIKDIIFKIKDYDRLEHDYSCVLEYSTGNMLSMTNYNLDGVYKAITEHLERRDKIVEEEFLKRLKDNAIHCKVSWYDGPLLDYTQEQQDDALERIGATVGDKITMILLKEE